MCIWGDAAEGMQDNTIWGKIKFSKVKTRQRERANGRGNEENPTHGSGYLLACDKETETRRKELLYEMLAPVFFGEKEAENEAELRDYFRQQYGIDVSGDFCEGDEHYEEYREAQQAIAEGLAVYGGSIAFDENSLARLAEQLWERAERQEQGGFRRINTFLEE